MKVRRFDLYPDDMIAGMIQLTNEERGVFATAIVAIYSHGAPIASDHLRRLCPGHARTHQRIVARLIELNKLCVTEDGKLTQKRCEKEIKNACTRLETSQENGRKGGRDSRKNNDLAKPTGLPRASPREGVAKTTTTFKKQIGEDGLGRCAPFERRKLKHRLEKIRVFAITWVRIAPGIPRRRPQQAVSIQARAS